MTRIFGHEKRMRKAIMQERIRKAAPQLLEALEKARIFADAYTDEDIIAARLILEIDEAIKAAKGE